MIINKISYKSFLFKWIKLIFISQIPLYKICYCSNTYLDDKHISPKINIKVNNINFLDINNKQYQNNLYTIKKHSDKQYSKNKIKSQRNEDKYGKDKNNNLTKFKSNKKELINKKIETYYINDEFFYNNKNISKNLNWFEKEKIPIILNDLIKINALMHFRLPIYQIDLLHLQAVISKVFFNSLTKILNLLIEKSCNNEELIPFLNDYKEKSKILLYMWKETLHPYQFFSEHFKKQYYKSSNACIEINEILQKKSFDCKNINLKFFLKIHLFIILQGTDFFYCYNFSKLTDTMLIYNKLNEVILKTLEEFSDEIICFQLQEFLTFFLHDKISNFEKNEHSKYLEILLKINYLKIKLMYAIVNFKFTLKSYDNKNISTEFCEEIKEIINLHLKIKKYITENFSYYIFNKMPVFIK